MIKASGLAAGKGVIVASSDSEAKATVNTILQVDHPTHNA